MACCEQFAMYVADKMACSLESRVVAQSPDVWGIQFVQCCAT